MSQGLPHPFVEEGIFVPRPKQGTEACTLPAALPASAHWARPALTSKDLVSVGGAEVQGEDPGNAGTVQALCRKSHTKPSHS